ncbi:MAG: branched-chain amino acid ABC transporter permease [Rhodocyclaceae bacterium]|nr:MAG: branched-chain amino acid ABC transporter permease [Rhodocyclaceae bacterium]
MNSAFRIRQRPTLILLGAVLLLSVLSYGKPYWLDNSIVIAIFSLLALSVGLCYGQAGILSMATAAFASVGAFGTAVLTTRYGQSPYVGLLFAVVAPVLLAYPLARALTRLSPLPLSIATFMISSLIELAVHEGGELTGGYIGISAIPRLSLAPTAQSMHFLSWGCVLVTVYLYVNLMRSTYGRAINTARHDPLRASADGVGVPHLLASTFAVSAAIAGVGGWLYAHHLTYMGPDSMTTNVSIQVLLMAVIGGAQTILGPIVGAAMLLLVTLYLPAAETQGMVFGGTLVFVLMVAPRGLLGTEWRALMRRRIFARTPTTTVKPGVKA